MGLGWKSALAAINPVAAIATGLSIGSDIYSAHEQGKATKEANKVSAAIAERELQAQKEFAQMGIRWRVDDAKAAGIHPLAALGASGASYSPSGQQVFADYSKSDLAKNLGQDIRSAASRAMTGEERSYLRESRLLDLRNKKLQGDVLKAQALDLSRPENPPFPTSMNLGPDRSTEYGQYPTRVFQYRPNGSIMVSPSMDYMQRNQDVPFAGMSWAIDNRLVPFIHGGVGQPPSVNEYPVPETWGKGPWTHWVYDRGYRGYVPGKIMKDYNGNEELVPATRLKYWHLKSKFKHKDEMFE